MPRTLPSWLPAMLEAFRTGATLKGAAAAAGVSIGAVRGVMRWHPEVRAQVDSLRPPKPKPKSKHRSRPNTPRRAAVLDDPLPWLPAFLAGLRGGATLRQAAQAAGIPISRVNWACDKRPEVKAAIDDARGGPRRRAQWVDGRPAWLPALLEQLRAGVTRKAAAQAIGITEHAIDCARQRSPLVADAINQARAAGRAPRPAPAAAVAVAEKMSMSDWLKLSDAEQARVLAGYSPQTEDDRAAAQRRREMKMREAQLKLGRLRNGGDW